MQTTEQLYSTLRSNNRLKDELPNSYLLEHDAHNAAALTNPDLAELHALVLDTREKAKTPTLLNVANKALRLLGTEEYLRTISGENSHHGAESTARGEQSK